MKKLLQSLFILMLCASSAMAQNRTITGTVTGKDDGLPLPGVSVKIKGSSSGTSTMADGKYLLSIPAGDVKLVFSYLGYLSQERAIGQDRVVNVILETDSKQLSEVVVTALGITKTRKDLGYNVQTVKGDQLVDRGDGNILNALQGKIAGADITGASGSAGASTNIILRGVTSYLGNNSPLFVVDGVPISNDLDQTLGTLYGNQPSNRVLDLNTNNIESVNTLLGPAAAALYGSRAANGAIIITTKKGSGGKGIVNISLNSAYGVQNIYGFPELQNDYGQGANGVFNSISTNSWGPKFGSTPTLANGLIVAAGTTPYVNGVTYKQNDVIPYQAFPNNITDYFEQGHTFENNLSISSGDAKNNINLSIGNSDQKGILPTSDYKKTTVLFSANSAVTEKLKVGGSINYINSLQDGGTTQGNGTNSSMYRLFTMPRSIDLNYYKDNYKNADGSNNWFAPSSDNPYFAANENPITSNLSRFLGNINLTYEVTNWLNVSYRLGLDTYTDRRKRIVTIGSTQEPTLGGKVIEDTFFRSELNGDLIITAKKTDILTDGLNATLLLGQNVNQRLFQNPTITAIGLTIPGFYNVSNGQDFKSSGEYSSKRRLLGVYGQLSLGYNNYLFLELTGRTDKSSTLPVANNTYFYPSVSTSFVFTDALKIQSDIFSMGKIRAAYAKVGKDADVYKLDQNYSSWTYGNNSTFFNFPYGSVTGFGASREIPNNQLKPEFTTSYEGGLNLGFFKNRITLDATIYNQVSKNQIVSAAIPTSTGYASFVTNVGEMTNKGVELILNAAVITEGQVKWDINANFAQNKNKVKSIIDGVTSMNVNGSRFGGIVPSIVVGQPYGVIVGSTYQRNANGDLIVDPATGLYATPLNTNQVVANPNRNWTAAITNTVRYKNFTFSALVDYKKGGDIVSWTVASLRANGSLKETGVDRELPHILPGVIANSDGSFTQNNIQIPAQTYWASGFGSIGGGEFAVFDATTLRLREVTLGYDLTGSMMKTNFIKSIRLTVYARNLFYYAPNSPIDPEVNTQGAGNIRGLELQSAPNTRNFGASVRVNF